MQRQPGWRRQEPLLGFVLQIWGTGREAVGKLGPGEMRDRDGTGVRAETADDPDRLGQSK